MGWARDWIVGSPRREAVTKPGHLYTHFTHTSCALFTPIHSCLLQEAVVHWVYDFIVWLNLVGIVHSSLN